MSRWVQLLSIQYVNRRKCETGDWVKVGNQVAEEWIAAGKARIADGILGARRTVDDTPSPIRPHEETHDLVKRIKEPARVAPGLKVAVGMIVFNGDYILEGILSSVYPWASQICIAEGPVKFNAERLGVESSTDRTVEIVRDFPDPDKKIHLIQGIWPEKTDMCNAWIKMVEPDTDYVWQFDSDEMYKQEDIQRVLSLLGPDGYDSVAFRFRSFYGGFERHMIGWEEAQETHRIQRFYPGASWATHRPPTILAPDGQPWRTKRHLSHWEIDAATGIRIFHYSFVFPGQVEMKYQYYNHLTKGHIVGDGFRLIYLPWVRGDDKGRAEIERQFKGVHHLERGPGGQCVCYTARYHGAHPRWIEEHRAELEARIRQELEQWA